MTEVDRQQADKSMTMTQLTDLMYRLMNAAWGPDWGIFTEAFPNGEDPTNIQLPVITYKVKRKAPAKLKSVSEIKPRIREQRFSVHPTTDEQTSETVFGQFFDHDVIFEVWEENNAKATAMAERFEDFIIMYKGFLMQNGASQIIFDEMTDINDSPVWREGLVCRKFVFYIRLEKQIVVPSETIKKVTGDIQVKGVLDDSIKSEKKQF